MIARRRLTNRTTAHDLRRPTSAKTPGSARQWYSIVNATAGTPAEIYLYDEIGLWGITAADFVNELSYLDAASIDLHVNSPGGDVFDGVAIYNALCNHPATITTYIDGLAASAASFIAQAGKTVNIARNGTMMIHDAEGICIGNCADMQEMADLLDRASNNIADIYAQRSRTVLQWRKAMKATSWYTGQEAVDAGLADKVYQPNTEGDGGSTEKRKPAARTTEPRPVATVAPPRTSSANDPDPPSADDDDPPESDLSDSPLAADPPEPLAAVVTVTEQDFVFEPTMLDLAFDSALRAETDPDFDPDSFRLAMASVGNNAPAVVDDAPAPPDLPPLPPPAPPTCVTCGHPTDGAEHVTVDAALFRQVMAHAADHAPALLDDKTPASVPADAVPGIDPGLFRRSLERGLL